MNSGKAPLPPELTEAHIQEVLKSIRIPPCPKMLMEVMAEVQKDVPNVNKLTASISIDPGMAAVVLKVANSPLFRTGNPISNVRTCIERLGMRNVVSVVVTGALHQSMTETANPYFDTFWDHTSAIAIAAGIIAKRQYGISPDAAYTYALFHDIGIPLMLQRFPEYSTALETSRKSHELLINVETQYFPCTHPVIGSLMIKSWGLPENVSKGIRFHHEPEVYDLPDHILPGGVVSLIAVTHVAERLSCEAFGKEDLEVGDVLYARACAHLGISHEELERLAEDLQSALQEIHH